MAETPTLNVVIVDDDLWVRTGRGTVLSNAKGIRLLAALDHEDALCRSELWDEADVVMVDAYDAAAGFDRFPGAGVVQAVRRHPRGQSIKIIVVTGHVTNDLLRVRMAEAGADLFFGHEEVSDAGRLLGVIAKAVELPPAEMSRSGRPRPQAAVEWVRSQGYEPAFSGESQKSLPVSRRAIMRIRREVGSLMGARGTPSWREARRLLDRARGANLNDDVDSDGG